MTMKVYELNEAMLQESVHTIRNVLSVKSDMELGGINVEYLDSCNCECGFTSEPNQYTINHRIENSESIAIELLFSR